MCATDQRAICPRLTRGQHVCDQLHGRIPVPVCGDGRAKDGRVWVWAGGETEGSLLVLLLQCRGQTIADPQKNILWGKKVKHAKLNGFQFFIPLGKIFVTHIQRLAEEGNNSLGQGGGWRTNLTKKGQKKANENVRTQMQPSARDLGCGGHEEGGAAALRHLEAARVEGALGAGVWLGSESPIPDISSPDPVMTP